MKTLKDVQQYCSDQIESFNDGILEQIRPYDELNVKILYEFKGRINAYNDIFEMLKSALKNHSCQFDALTFEYCVFCGERKE